MVSAAAPQRPVATVLSTGSSATVCAASGMTVVAREVSVCSAGEQDQQPGVLSPTQLRPFADSPLSPLPAASPAAAVAAAAAAATAAATATAISAGPLTA